MSEGRRGLALLIALTLVASLLSLGVVFYLVDFVVVLSSWALGEPRLSIRLEVLVPHVDAEYCAVMIRSLKPIARCGAERPVPCSREVYSGRVAPGGVVSVGEFLEAVVAQLDLDRATDAYKVGYYDSAVYLVMVFCPKRGGGRIRTELVEEPAEGSAHSPASTEGPPAPSARCGMHERVSVHGLTVAECVTWVRGPRLYSIEGVETSFGVNVGTMVYLETFADFVAGTSLPLPEGPRWMSAGKKGVGSSVAGESGPLSGNRRDRVYFNVGYVYEHGCRSDLFGTVYCWWILYPSGLFGVGLSSSISWAVPGVASELEEYAPEPAPEYAIGPSYGDKVVPFSLMQTTFWYVYSRPYLSDEAIAETRVNFTLGPTSWTLTVHFYRAARDDRICGVPYVRIRDVSGRRYVWYWRWFRDDDSTTFELMLSDRKAKYW